MNSPVPGRINIEDSEANADMHESTTGQEILAGFAGQRLDYFVTGYGTGGSREWGESCGVSVPR